MADNDESPQTPEPVDLDAINPSDEPKLNPFQVNSPRLCGAAARSTGKPCRNVPRKDQKRCKFHGGNSPKAKARAEREETVRQAERAVRQLRVKPVDDPLTALRTLAGEVLAWKSEMLRHVHALKSMRYSTENGEAVRGEIMLYERAMDRAAVVLTAIAKLNIDERLAAVTERQAKMLEDGLFAAFEAAGIPITDPDTRENVAVAFGRNLSVVR
jgi:hypothetical protein